MKWWDNFWAERERRAQEWAELGRKYREYIEGPPPTELQDAIEQRDNAYKIMDLWIEDPELCARVSLAVKAARRAYDLRNCGVPDEPVPV
jgi:hypothetical protein